MNAKGMGFVAGLIVGLVLVVILFRIANKDKKIKSEYDTEKKRQYEKELKQVENELAVKNTDSYRKQNTIFS